jgi:hypothetical protein
MKRTPLKRQSKKRQRINQEKRRIYQELGSEENWIESICSGCEQRKPLSHSHIIPISEAPELENEKKNIKPHCCECHLEWESHNIERMRKLKDFKENMTYIYNIKPLYYAKLNGKIS